jgi:tryptophan-rich sensory protein
VVFLIICLGAEMTGGLLTRPSLLSGWYAGLRKPAFNPPAWIFGPVWTVLFLLMAVAVWMVWRQSDKKPVRVPLIVFYIQLILNVGWSGLFFGLRHPGLALAEIVVLWLLILLTVILFYRIHRTAGLILLPYLAWVCFAVVLNGAIWWMNRWLLPLEGGIIS